MRATSKNRIYNKFNRPRCTLENVPNIPFCCFTECTTKHFKIEEGIAPRKKFLFINRAFSPYNSRRRRRRKKKKRYVNIVRGVVITWPARLAGAICPTLRLATCYFSAVASSSSPPPRDFPVDEAGASPQASPSSSLLGLSFFGPHTCEVIPTTVTPSSSPPTPRPLTRSEELRPSSRIPTAPFLPLTQPERRRSRRGIRSR